MSLLAADPTNTVEEVEAGTTEPPAKRVKKEKEFIDDDNADDVWGDDDE